MNNNNPSSILFMSTNEDVENWKIFQFIYDKWMVCNVTTNIISHDLTEYGILWICFGCCVFSIAIYIRITLS